MPNKSKTVPIIGFDAEWQYDPQSERNQILSYQFAGRVDGKAWSGIFYTEGLEGKDRLDAALAPSYARDR